MNAEVDRALKPFRHWEFSVYILATGLIAVSVVAVSVALVDLVGIAAVDAYPPQPLRFLAGLVGLIAPLPNLLRGIEEQYWKWMDV